MNILIWLAVMGGVMGYSLDGSILWSVFPEEGELSYVIESTHPIETYVIDVNSYNDYLFGTITVDNQLSDCHLSSRTYGFTTCQLTRKNTGLVITSYQNTTFTVNIEYIPKEHEYENNYSLILSTLIIVAFIFVCIVCCGCLISCLLCMFCFIETLSLAEREMWLLRRRNHIKFSELFTRLKNYFNDSEE